MPGTVIVAGARTPIGKLVRCPRRFRGHRARWLRHRRRPRAGRGDTRPGRLRVHGPGHPGRRGPDHRPPGRGQGRHPDDRARHHGQQGLPVRPQRHLPGRPDDQRRRGRHRGRRRHGVDDPGPLPAARGPRRLPDRRRHHGRLDDVRRPVLRLRQLRHGPRHRALQRRRRRLPRAPGRLRRPLPRTGGGRHQGRASSPTRSSRSRSPSARATPWWSTPTRASAPRPRPSRWASCARRSTRTAPSPPATPPRSPTAAPRSS